MACGVALALGRYEYKFVLDGEWCCEPGTQESVEHSDCRHERLWRDESRD